MHIEAVDIAFYARAKQMRPLATELDQAGAVGAGCDGRVKWIERGRRIGIAVDMLPQLPELDGGCDLVARRQPVDPSGAAVNRIVGGIGRALKRHGAEARHVAAAVARTLERSEHRANIEE